MLKKALFGFAICWTVIIAFLCFITFSDLPSLPVSGADKYVHVLLHFAFVMLWGFYVSLTQNEIRITKIIRLVLLSILYGIVIEVFQEFFTTTRHADILDVLANFTGAILALMAFVLMKRQKADKH